jgi:hypothetical protein
MAKCEEEKAALETELSECEEALATVESDAAAEVAVMRQEWEDTRNSTADLSSEVEAKDEELKQLEDENRELNRELISELGRIGTFIQVTRITPEEETRQWLGCLDEKTTIELQVRMCQSKKDVAVVRARTQREHYRGLKDSAHQNKQMVEGRLKIVTDMIQNAKERKERLTAQISQIKGITNGTSVSTVQTAELLIDIDTSAAVESSSTTSASGCEMLAEKEGRLFSTETSSNGVPAGCVRYDDGHVAFVETCRNHTNCCTAKCNGCTVLAAEACDDEERCAAEATQANLPYSTEWLSDGAPAGCVRYDDGRVTYVQACVDHANCGTTKCNGCTLLFAATGSNLWSLLAGAGSLEKAIAPVPSMLAYRLLNTKVNGTSQEHGPAAAAEAPRKEKLLNAKPAVVSAAHDSTTTQTRTSLRAAKMVKLGDNQTDKEITTANDEEPKGDHTKQAEKVDPLVEARERLKTIDDEIKAQRKKVEAHNVVADITKNNMNAEARNQREVAKKLRHVKNKTMLAFQKAFELDYELDTMETLHDEAYVAAKNATRMYERASRAEHEAVAELQQLITKKHRYMHVVSTAEDFETEEAVRHANEEDEERHSAARTIGLAVFVLWSTNLFGSA